MFNFSDFCKNKKCPYYVERTHSAGIWRYCELVGTSFYVVQRPDNCPHLKEIDAIAAYEKEKAQAWEKLSTKTAKPKSKFNAQPLTDEQLSAIIKNLRP